ncbi:hypothetical protein MA16_Dca015293 [Dendrobium catenatum]|uniref:Uncharacterized protein n=1 Tax=Dendrobium catenatum TaxID=906689 RepID=A0A2I0X025_9ASPA|nr:hypothetical protein MA16_Dca015293 [Dendrobium catenatum]
MRILKIPDIEHLLFEVRHISINTEEEFLFKVGLSLHARRSDARMLKPTSKVPEPPAPALKVAPKRLVRGEDPQVLKKKRLEGTATNADNALPSSSPAKFHIAEDVLNHQCIRRRKTDDIKYLQGEFKRKYDQKTKEEKVLEEELNECRTKLANTIYFVSLQNRQANRHQIDLADAQAIITQLLKDQKAFEKKIASLEAKDKRSQTLIAEKEAALSGSEPSRVFKDFKKSIAFKIIIQDHVQKARDHIYDKVMLGREPTLVELHSRTHKRQEDQQWIDERARKAHEDYTRLRETHAASGEGSSGGSVEYSEYRIWSQAVGGMQHGRVYGLGAQAQAYEGMTSSTASSFASSSYESLQAQQISALQAELEQVRKPQADWQAQLQAQVQAQLQAHVQTSIQQHNQLLDEMRKMREQLSRKDVAPPEKESTECGNLIVSWEGIFFVNATGFRRILRRKFAGKDDTTNRIVCTVVFVLSELTGVCGVYFASQASSWGFYTHFAAFNPPVMAGASCDVNYRCICRRN